jgi:NAD(P)-dependent dehydrogenase (short-subunit alcohol dehydrogenase family)
LQDFDGKVAVVTGGASGIGLALCRALAAEGMRIVVADVEQGALDRAVDALSSTTARREVVGVRTDVSDAASVEALAKRTFDELGACHLLCNNAGVGAPSANVWDTTINDWKWVHGVNVMGVVHGVLAFVPRMIDSGEPGHVVNTSSGDGGIAPLPTASVYAASKAAVSVLTECLASQLASEDTFLQASIFYPSGGLLKTGLWTADRNRPAELARERPRTTPAMTVEQLEDMARKAGRELPIQDLDELAQIFVDGVRNDRFVIMKDVASMGPTLRERAEHLERGEIPTAHRLG